jgi:hypothetical protein
MKIGYALAELHRSESALAARLRRAAERHKADHDTFYLGQDLARWSEDHVRLIADHARRYGQELDPAPSSAHHPVAAVREKVGELVSREPDAGLLLLADLREIYQAAAGVSVDWELISQAAQGAKDLALIELAQKCHPDNLRQMRWANAKLKQSATQVLLS